MTRAFRPDPVPGSLVDELIELAGRSPSAGNTGGAALRGPRPSTRRRGLLVGDAAGRAAGRLPLARSARRPGAARAVRLRRGLRGALRRGRTSVAGRRRRRTHAAPSPRRAGWAVPYWYVDGGMAVMSLLLAAEAAGLGALFFGLFEHEADVRALLRIPDGLAAAGHRRAGLAPMPAAASRAGRWRRIPDRGWRSCATGVPGLRPRAGDAGRGPEGRARRRRPRRRRRPDRGGPRPGPARRRPRSARSRPAIVERSEPVGDGLLGRPASVVQGPPHEVLEREAATQRGRVELDRGAHVERLHAEDEVRLRQQVEVQAAAAVAGEVDAPAGHRGDRIGRGGPPAVEQPGRCHEGGDARLGQVVHQQARRHR